MQKKVSRGEQIKENARGTRSHTLYRRSRDSCIVRVQVKLDKDDGIFENRAQRPNQPGDRVEQVLLVLRVCDEADAICKVASERQEEEEDGEACIAVSNQMIVEDNGIIGGLPSQDFSL